MAHDIPRPKPSSSEQRPSAIWRREREMVTVREDCKIKNTCGTCQYINSDYMAGIKEKFERDVAFFKESDLLKNATVLAPSPSPKPLAYRAHAKLAVRSADKVVKEQKKDLQGRRFALGLFRRETHEVINLPFCPLHRGTINRAVSDLVPLLEESVLEPYNEESGSGDLRYLAIRASHLTDELMVTFVVTKDCAPVLKRIVAGLKKSGHKISAAHMNLNNESGNAIFGATTKHIAGAQRLRENLCQFDFEIGATSFFQVNPWMAEMIYRRLEALVGQGRNRVAWDLYSGTGTISMLLARSGYRVLGIEENPQAGRDAQYNTTRNELPTSPFFLTGRVEDQLHALPGWADSPSLILVNPSRRGMDDAVCRALAFQLAQLDDALLIYLSCEAKTLVRDLAKLGQSGIAMRQLEAYDMFPHTDKLEWIAVAQKLG